MRDDVPIRNSNNRAARRASTHGKQEAISKDDIVRLLRLWPQEFNDESLSGKKRLIALIERALREERRRSRAGHMAYDIARHSALLSLLEQQRDRLAKVE